MATIALIAAYDAPPQDRTVLTTGSELAKLCRTDPRDPKTVDLKKLYFLMIDGGLARDTFCTLTAGISSTWNPEPKQIHAEYALFEQETDRYRVALALIEKMAGEDKFVAVVGNREAVSQLLVAIGSNGKSDGCLQFIGQGFPNLPGEMVTIDTATGEARAFDPRA